MTSDEPVRSRRRWRLIPGRRLTIVITWLLVLAWAGFAVVRIFGWERTWILDVAMPFTPYLALATILPLGLALALRRWNALAIAALTAIALATVFIPRAFGQADPGHGPTLRVMSQNMKIGAADPATVVGLVRSHHIDLLAVDEFTPQADDALTAAGLTSLLPFSATHPLPGATGSAIYSRYPLSDPGYQNLAGGFGQEYATVTVPRALPLVVVAVHTRAPALAGEQTDWARSIAQQPAATPHGAVRMLAGDFNATFDQKPLRTLLATGYVDVASQLGDGMKTTWPYDGRWIPPVPVTLDHFFVDPRIGCVSFGTQTVKGTDHRAIFAVVTLPIS
ncbi:MAG TPA: endonuclease/exonuclease/phosphatase family protein, partial [Micromonosporaceae bacterium]